MDRLCYLSFYGEEIKMVIVKRVEKTIYDLFNNFYYFIFFIVLKMEFFERE